MASQVQENASASKMHMLLLPNEILRLILRHLEYADDAIALSQTCRVLYAVINPTIVSDYANRDMVVFALQNWDHALMEKILKSGVDIEDLLPRPVTEIMLDALRNGYLEFFRVMLDYSPSPDTNAYASYLSCATMNGYLDIARLLISRGANPDANTLDYQTALIETAGKGSLPAVRFLVEEANCGLNVRGIRGVTPLISAASSGSLDVVEYLLKSGADPTLASREHRTLFRDEDRTPFGHAAENLREHVVLFLLENNQYGDYLQNQADRGLVAKVGASRGSKAIAKMLLDRLDLDAMPMSRSSRDEMFPFLLVSAACGFDLLVQKMLEKGCSPIEEEQRRTLLKGAVENGQAKAVELILDSVEDMYPYRFGVALGDVLIFASIKNQWQILQTTLDRKKRIGIYGNPALQYAIHYEETTRILLERGADPAVNGDCGLEIIQKALTWGNIAVAKMLLEKSGLGPSTEGNYWSKLLEFVAEKSDLNTIKAILQATNNAGFHPDNPEYQQALAIATFLNPNKDVIEFFLDHGFDVNLKSSSRLGKGRPLLAIAARRSQFLDPVISLYIDRGADIELPDEKDQRTPLSWASDGGSYDSAKQLLEHGADPFSKDRRGRTVLHRAALGDWTVGLKAILKTMEAQGIQYDFTSIISALESALKKKKSKQKRPDLHLKYVRQHLSRMKYPCP